MIGDGMGIGGGQLVSGSSSSRFVLVHAGRADLNL